MRLSLHVHLAACFMLSATLVASAQPPGGQFGGPPGRQQGQGLGDGRGGPRGGERFGQLGRPGGSELLALFDADHDGELSTKEIEDAAAALKKLDKDADGKVSKEELPAKAIPEVGPGMGPPPGGGFVGFGPGGFGPAGNAGNRANNNRQVNKGNKQGNRQGMQPGGPPPGGAFPGGPPPSSDELVSQSLEFDADGDGKLDKEELAKFAAKMAARPRGPGERGPGERGPGGREGGKPGQGNGGVLPKF